MNTQQTPEAAARTMAAVVQDRYGSRPEEVFRLARTDRPAIGAREVLVRVHAASVDRGTWHVMAGLPYPIRLAGFGVRRPKHTNPGRALAGTVEAVGAEVTGLARGDEVFGIGSGAFAEYSVARPDKLTARPTNLSFEQAAAVPVSGLTALQAVRDHARVRPGQRVLVIGAAGGVGSFAVQLAAAAGAEVTGVAGPGGLDAVRALGAAAVLDHTRDDVLGQGRRYDVILDIAGNRPLPALRGALTPRGRLVIVGGETGGRWLGGTDRQLRAQALSPFVGQHLGTFVASENARDLQALRELIEAGTVTPLIDRVFPLGEAAAAVRHLLDGHPRGKIVVAVR